MMKEKIIEMIEAHIIDAIEHCADVEYYDTVKDLDVGHFLTMHEIFEVAQYAAINMDDELIKHEQDTLKEFVEWSINCVSVGNDILECKTLATSLTTDADTREFCAKRYAAFSQYSSGLRFSLEQFFKMKGIEVDK